MQGAAYPQSCFYCVGWLVDVCGRGEMWSVLDGGSWPPSVLSRAHFFRPGTFVFSRFSLFYIITIIQQIRLPLTLLLSPPPPSL